MQLATQQKWIAYIDQQQKSNLTVAQFCKQLKVSSSSFHQRKRELSALPNTAPSFIKANVTSQGDIDTRCAPIILTLEKIKVSLPPQTSADYLASLIKGITL